MSCEILPRLFVGDTGTILNFDLEHDVSSATTREIHVRRPDKSEAIWSAVAHPSDVNKIRYTTISTDLDMAGLWRANAVVDLTTPSWDGTGDTVEFEVFEKYQK